jgi:hypothetical protein
MAASKLPRLDGSEFTAAQAAKKEFQMATFQERKAARKLNPAPKFSKFNVVASFPFDGEVVGIFALKRDAEDFAFKQRGLVVGNTSAMHAIYAKHPGELVPASMVFFVQGVEA